MAGQDHKRQGSHVGTNVVGPGLSSPDGGLDKLILAPDPGQAYARLVLRPHMCCLCLRSKPFAPSGRHLCRNQFKHNAGILVQTRPRTLPKGVIENGPRKSAQAPGRSIVDLVRGRGNLQARKNAQAREWRLRNHILCETANLSLAFSFISFPVVTMFSQRGQCCMKHLASVCLGFSIYGYEHHFSIQSSLNLRKHRERRPRVASKFKHDVVLTTRLPKTGIVHPPYLPVLNPGSTRDGLDSLRHLSDPRLLAIGAEGNARSHVGREVEVTTLLTFKRPRHLGDHEFLAREQRRHVRECV